MSGRSRPPRQRRAELSQHFLRDASAARLVQATSITQADFVIEIGPGRGALTKALSRHAQRVTAVELDPYLAQKLVGRFRNVRAVQGDFLDYRLPKDDYIVAGNLPYNRSTDMIRKIADAPHPPLDAWLVVQRELAHRMCGLPFDQESIWSLRLKPWWHLEIADHLRRVEFDPPPSVDSVFLHMQHRTRPLVAGHLRAGFIQLIEDSFRSNKPISLALKPLLSKKQLRRISSELKFNPHDPPSRLMFEQWLGIFRTVTRQSS